MAASINYRLGFHPVKAEVREAEMRALEDPILPYEEGYPLNNGLKHISDYFYGTHAIHEKAVSLGIPAEHHPCPEPRHALHLDETFSFTPRFAEIRDAMAAFFATFGGPK